MSADAEVFVTSLKIAAIVTISFGAFLAFVFWAAQDRLRVRWKGAQRARIELAGNETSEILSFIAETLKRYGYQAVNSPQGIHTFVPPGFRRNLDDAKNINVEFTQEGKAIVTGTAQIVAKLTKNGEVWLISESVVPFMKWIKQHFLVKMIVLLAFLFFSILLIGLNFL